MEAVISPTLDRWFTGAFRARRPDVIERVVSTLRADDPSVHAAMWDMIADLEFCARLGEVACPTLVLVGALDPSTPPAAAQLLAEAIGGAEVRVLAQTSHLTPLEVPDAVNQHLRFFLEHLHH